MRTSITRRAWAFFGASLGIASLAAGCATTGNYEKRVFSWEGKDAKTLVKSWGKPDSIEKQANGNKIYLYSRLKHEPYAFRDSRRAIASDMGPKTPAPSLYLKCATYFEVNPKEKIVSTEYRGDDCKWKN